MYINTESLCCTSKANKRFYVKYSSIKKKREGSAEITYIKSYIPEMHSFQNSFLSLGSNHSNDTYVINQPNIATVLALFLSLCQKLVLQELQQNELVD